MVDAFIGWTDTPEWFFILYNYCTHILGTWCKCLISLSLECMIVWFVHYWTVGQSALFAWQLLVVCDNYWQSVILTGYIHWLYLAQNWVCSHQVAVCSVPWQSTLFLGRLWAGHMAWLYYLPMSLVSIFFCARHRASQAFCWWFDVWLDFIFTHVLV